MGVIVRTREGVRLGDGRLPAVRARGAGAAAVLAAWLLAGPAGAQVAETGAALSLQRAMQLAVERSQLVAANRAQAAATLTTSAVVCGTTMSSAILPSSSRFRIGEYQ